MNAYDDDDDGDLYANGTDLGEDSDEEPVVPCPYCHREILEDSPRCPHCERYLSAEDRAGSPQPAWVIATALVCLGVAV